MKAARLVVLGVAVAAGGIAAYLAAGRKAPPAPPPVAAAPPMVTVDVLVAKSDLSRGQVIQNQDIGWQTWPKDAANANFIQKSQRPDAINEFAGSIARVTVLAGDPIRPPDVVTAKGSGFMAVILPKGMRAIAVDITAVSSAGGFILPDDRVDVLLTRHERSGPSGSEKTTSDTILSNVRVLAVDQSIDEKADTKVILGKTATLELTEAQAETLEQAKQLGTVSLTLRSILDSASSGPESNDDGHDQAINTIRFGVSAAGAGR
ncbi:MAG: Flp pilus assembly protein CpaB [Xanthobacteraceae bacterium]